MKLFWVAGYVFMKWWNTDGLMKCQARVACEGWQETWITCMFVTLLALNVNKNRQDVEKKPGLQDCLQS